MRTRSTSCILWLVLAATAAGNNSRRPLPFERYDVILQRRPFAAVVREVAPQPADEDVAAREAFKHYRMCAITSDGEKLCVGLVDNQTKPPTSYLIGLGESENGIELLEADYAQARALIRKGVHTQWLSMGPEDSVLDPMAPDKDKSPLALSFAQRLRQRREAVQRKRDAMEARQEAAKSSEDKRRETQMERLRRGEAPLPIPLTPAMDDQLVSEGVLPPKGKQIEETMGDGPTVEESVVDPPVEGTNSGAKL
ncbi:MAG: hypothetical protein HN919_16115 [Verrucomicrobia bacterium]|nr:hypothetical protein [Verrucomicrobiota bacterium]MBT7067825.1 hypothetical protein [Verrucomicrobiota bacterium]MBT7701969.1 hypothetical protein [Verrucomicrobiota bacterium]